MDGLSIAVASNTYLVATAIHWHPSFAAVRSSKIVVLRLRENKGLQLAFEILEIGCQ